MIISRQADPKLRLFCSFSEFLKAIPNVGAGNEDSASPGFDEAARSIIRDLINGRLTIIPAKQASVPPCVCFPSSLQRDQVCETDGLIVLGSHAAKFDTVKPKRLQEPAVLQELRKELQNVKKLAHTRTKVITMRIQQLKDCKNHFDQKKKKCMTVFICNGRLFK